MTKRAYSIMIETLGRVVDHLGIERSRELIGLLDDVFNFYADDAGSGPVCPSDALPTGSRQDEPGQ